MADPLPASSTKHLDVCLHPFPKDRLTILPLSQISATTSTASNGTSSTGTTGTTLWRGAQVLSTYLSSLPLQPHSIKKKRAVELGAGVGYLSLVLASLGYDVIATDIPPVLEDVLRPNIENGMNVLRRRTTSTHVFPGRSSRASNTTSSARISESTSVDKQSIGEVSVRELDWTKVSNEQDVQGYDVDMIITSDTVYHPDLLPHLYRTISLLSSISTKIRGTPPTIYLCLERRDSRLVDSALSLARTYGIHLKRIGQGRVVKSIKEAGWGWTQEDWEEIEVYKGKWTKEGEEDASKQI